MFKNTEITSATSVLI